MQIRFCIYNNRLIAVIDGNRFYDHNTGDGEWKKINVLLNPIFEEH
jgi:hypothetical protein